MPLTPAAIAQRTESTTFQFAGESVTITYRAGKVGAITKAEADGWETTVDALDEADARAFLAGLVCEYIASWDVVESINEDGSLGPMVPLSVERISVFDPAFLGTVLAEAIKAVRLGNASAPSSSVASGASSSPATPAISPADSSPSPSASSSSPAGSKAPPASNG